MPLAINFSVSLVSSERQDNKSANIRFYKQLITLQNPLTKRHHLYNNFVFNIICTEAFVKPAASLG